MYRLPSLRPSFPQWLHNIFAILPHAKFRLYSSALISEESACRPFGILPSEEFILFRITPDERGRRRARPPSRSVPPALDRLLPAARALKSQRRCSAAVHLRYQHVVALPSPPSAGLPLSALVLNACSASSCRLRRPAFDHHHCQHPRCAPPSRQVERVFRR